MKNYLVMSANKTEFREACKRFKVKGVVIPCYVKSIPVYAFRTKKEAIQACRQENNLKPKTEIEFLLKYDSIHYIEEISIY